MDPLFSFSGIASGIDTASIVQSLVQLERRPIRRMETEQEGLRSRQGKLDNIKDLLSTLQGKSTALDERAKVLTSSASSSHEDAVGVTVDGGASLGSFDVTVTQLATAERTYSDPFAAKNQSGLFGTGDLDIQVGADAAVTITVDANSTLESVVSDINSSGASVTAGILFDGTNYHLQVTGNETGSDNAITFTEGGSLTLDLDDIANEKQAALAAAFTVDGFAMTRQGNVVTDAIPGVSLELKDETTSAATVSIQRDPEALGDLLDEFVTAYNEVNKRINYELFSAGSSQEADSLMGESVVRTVQQKLRSTMTDTVGGLSSPYNYFASIGVSIDRTGELSLDRSALEEALADDPEAVAKLLMDDTDGGGTVGMMSLMDTTIEGLVNSTDGLLTSRTEGIDGRIESLDDQILRMELRIDKYEEQIRGKFTAMEMAMSLMQGQSAQLIAMLGGAG